MRPASLDKEEAVGEQTMLELYNAPVSTCGQKIRMALFEKELPLTNKTVQFARRNHLNDW